ncbi:hypothetical protein KNP414_06678 [Paenibacillus mucilaginosus KNP414]|uniref:Uncharacterized protein n=1 Tax=Paenibacillus mucilaginosus (strain KNP414) TaxID=1036673 RepID=F8F9Z9_PAEMK|nr:hypothetical protein KNP414_06678 [Paenibacillus mucilaginosus KNP414]
MMRSPACRIRFIIAWKTGREQQENVCGIPENGRQGANRDTEGAG